MKRFTLIIASLALLIGFSHCKKDNDTPNTNDNRIQVTLNANYGDNGSKTTFNPANGSFAWNTSTTEYINVGGKVSGYLGQLSNEGDKGTGNFSGNITTPDAGETMLYFFYLGNGNHEGASTVDFSSQDGTLANVTNCHIAIGSEEYTGQTSFTATLNMAMAIAYFDLSQFTSDSKAAETVYLNGNHIYSTASVNYNDGTITGNSKGQIKVGTANNGMYVALIPSVETETTLNFNSSSKTGSMTFNNGIKPASFYSNSGGALLVEATAGSGIPGTFSVSATKKVFFSKGNLQYTRKTTSDNWSTGVWSFMENQNDIVENSNVSADYADQTRVSLFGWATSGHNLRGGSEENYCYKPFNTNNNSNYYGPSEDHNLVDDYYVGDWGSNLSSWRTLSWEEWNYLLLTRKTVINETEKAAYGEGKVNGVEGLIILPDNWNGTVDNNFTYGKSQWSNTYSANSSTTWDEMESAGAIFLPAAGYRNNTSYYNTTKTGYYWSSSYKTTNNSQALALYIGKNAEPAQVYSSNKHNGYSVRLVKDVE